MKASTHVFATDLVDEGFGTVLDRARDVAGLDGVVYAGIYHHARDILPHNPRRKVVFHEGGAAYFRPSAERFRDARIQPKVSRLVEGFDPLARLIDEAGRRDLAVRVWTNNLHNTALGTAYPDCATVNAFGDPYITGLCPANPDVRAYVRAMSAEIAGYGVSALLLESLCYQPFAHGYHHERSHFAYSPVALYLLGLCLCRHCLAAGRVAGVDVDGLSGWIRAELERILDGRPSPVDAMALEREPVAALAGGELGGFLRAREEVVTSLLAEVVADVRAVAATPVTFIDWSGGLLSYDTGDPGTRGAISRTWQDGVDLDRVAAVVDGISALGYTRDVPRFRADLETYRDVVPAGTELSLAVRPMPPDCTSLDELRAKVEVAAAGGVDWLEFYHYGLMRLEQVGWIGDALAAVRV